MCQEAGVAQSEQGEQPGAGDWTAGSMSLCGCEESLSEYISPLGLGQVHQLH